MRTQHSAGDPHCWRVDLATLAAARGPAELEPIDLADADGPGSLPAGWSWADLLRAGGAATAVALTAWAHGRAPGRQALALAVGPAVRDGLATAARAHVAARSPLTGRLSEGLVGGELGPRLAALGQGWLIAGELPAAEDAVLRLLPAEPGGRPRAELLRWERPDSSRPIDTTRWVRERWGPGAVLAVGPAARLGVRFANLANEARPPSFVGRGGLGRVLAELGLDALQVTSEPTEPRVDADWTARLARSPRLVQRGAQGSFELFEAAAARGQGVARAASSPEAGHVELRRERGCRGCPTPCGWVFERGGRPAAGAHYAALAPFGGLLGLRDREEQGAVLRACDDVGVDAKESARVLRVLGIVGDASACAAEVERWGREADSGVARGADALALALGREAPDLLASAEPIQRLGARTSGGASDPMRSFPFLVDGTPNALALELLSQWGFDSTALDPSTFEAKAHLLWWHERVVAAVDTAGFCAFSAGALLADGLASPDELMERLFAGQRTGPRTAAEGLGLGDAICRARELLDAHFLGERDDAHGPAPEGDPRLETAYAEYRDLCARGPLRSSLAVGARSVPGDAAHPAPVPREGARSTGRLTVRANGPLGAALEGVCELELPLPATLDEVLEALLRVRPAAAAFLRGAGGPAAAAHLTRDGHSRRLAPAERLAAGDELWLVVALPGG
jgi:aldehyde:ferredoxin oxidoreductase